MLLDGVSRLLRRRWVEEVVMVVLPLSYIQGVVEVVVVVVAEEEVDNNKEHRLEVHYEVQMTAAF